MTAPEELVVTAAHESESGASYASYIVGFLVSICLTVTAYLLVTQRWLSGEAALFAIAGLAVLQFMVQLLCFLHIGGETRPRWKQLVFWFMILVVFIVVGGSIWIMNNLNYNMTQHQIKTYLNDQDNL